MRRLAPTLGLILFLAACSPAPTLAPTQPAAPAPTSTSPATTSAVPAPTNEPASPALENSSRPQYELRVSLDLAGHFAGVIERIRYTNRTAAPLAELVLAVEPARWPGAFALKELSLDGQPASPQLSGARMSIPLAPPLATGGSVVAEIHYELNIPQENDRYLFGYNQRQTNLIDWYPFIVPYKPGQGWVLHEPAAAGEHLVYESADFDVALRFLEPGHNEVVAASAPSTDAGEGTTSFHLDAARGFALSVSDSFLSTSVDAGGVTVTSYYFDGQQAAGLQAARMAAQALRLFSEKFAPYPYKSLNVVESASADGMEADGLFFMAGHFYDTYDGTLQNYLTTLSVHETAHQWWYSLVGNDQALEPWLDEALATYSEWIFYRAQAPDLINWWWDFRLRRFDPQGAANGSIYDNGSFRTYTNATYFRGAYFLEDLRVRVGDEAFYATLADYAKSNAGQIASAQDFFEALKRHTNVDYSDLLAQYFK